MPLDKASLKTAIRTLTDDLYNNTGNLSTEDCRDIYANRLSIAIDAFVRSGLVTVDTTGSATVQHGVGNIT